MKRNTTLIAAIVVLLVGIAAFAFLRPGDTAAEPLADSEAKPESRSTSGGSSDLRPTRSITREPRQDESADLVEKYGESRTNLSRQVANNVTSMLDDVLEMGDLMTSGQGGQFGNRSDWAIRGALRGTGVELTEEQKTTVADLYTEFQKRELEKTRSAVEALKEEPSVLMSLMLASDARSRDEISEDQYKAIQATSATELEGILNPLDRNNFRGGQPMEDPAFRSGFESLLDPDQSEAFNTAMSEREASGEEKRELTNITEMPVMDLESLDQSISSAKQMTSGFKNIMQGMGNLQELEKQRSGTDNE
ncbi:hypothetical protein [Haloferula sp.]|uniref:hypothetical protein n=1 Tax=Haloferula sp. TaxID=2497595 RepID=UPI003C731C6F